MDKERLAELIDSFKALASLSMLAVAENDIQGAITLNSSLKRIFKFTFKICHYYYNLQSVNNFV